MRTKIMAIINATHDSFYKNSCVAGDVAVNLGIKFVDEGASIIDIGGESTRPGSNPIPASEELKRILPIIERLSGKISAKISVDTYKPEVAEAALKSGASIVNDITGMRTDAMRTLVADYKAECVIMHMLGNPKTMQDNPNYGNVVAEVSDFLHKRAEVCKSDGIKPENIIFDPGIGFGKTTKHNIELIRGIPILRKLGKRVMIGASRKSFIGKILESESFPVAPEERLDGSLAVASFAVLNGVDILRVHDVKETVRAIKIIEALI